ncbi:MAG TPA: hypothetical protein P5531_14620 [Bacteroidales bacterium]|nr:hypothetical protein [Bacteroidales bacterium]HSA44827.1 hypothetical protein [Bacteroidales bacterium]
MRSTVVFFMMILALQLRGQYYPDARRDYIWNFGYDDGPTHGGIIFDFNTSPMTVSYPDQEVDFVFTNASMCSPEGDLLFYTNGKQVANHNRVKMPHGDSLNYGFAYNYWDEFGYRIPYGAIALPYPGSPERYVIIHEKWCEDFNCGISELLATTVDMTLDGGLGDVTEKNFPVIVDSLDMGLLSACRHANGRDWWIIAQRQFYDWYYILLLSPQGINLWQLKKFSETRVRENLVNGSFVFSTNGTKIIKSSATYVSQNELMEILHFDRCYGNLIKYQEFYCGSNSGIAGKAVSPDSRYLYVTKGRELQQYDLEAQNIEATKHIIHYLPNTDHFSSCILAPDGKIYFQHSHNNLCMSVVNHPDLYGSTCDFQLNAVCLSRYSTFIPNFPHFRLGRIAGSECDTIPWMHTEDVYKEQFHLTVSPNPVHDMLTLDINGPFDAGEMEFSLYNLTGQQVKKYRIAPWQSILREPVNDLAEGVYTGVLIKNNRSAGRVKVVVVR